MPAHVYLSPFERWRVVGVIGYLLFATAVATIVFTLPLFIITIGFSVLFLYLGCFFLLAYAEYERKPLPVLQKWPSVSIVLPAYNRGEGLRTCLEKVVNLQYPHQLQIIVVDDASTDQTLNILNEFKSRGVHAIHQSVNKGKAHSINVGIKQAKGEIIVVMDGDSQPQEDALIKLIPNFYAEENVGAVTTIVRVKNRNGILQKIQEVEYFLEFGLKNMALHTMDALYVTPGPLSAYTKEALNKTGGYDESNITEDMELTFHLHRLGYRVILEPDAYVYTDVPDTVKKLYRQRQRWSYGGWQTIYKYRKHLFSKQKLFFRFFFPLRVVMEISAILFFLLGVRLILNYYYDILGFFSAFSTLSYQGVLWPPLYVNSHLLLYILIIALTGLMTYAGSRASRAKVTQLSPIGVVLFLSVYWVFIVHIQVTSLLKIIAGGKQRW